MYILKFKKSALRFLIVFCACVYSTTIVASALSPEQKKIYDMGINYYDVAACGEGSAELGESSQISGDAQELARQVLNNSKITYWVAPPQAPAADWANRVPSGGNKTQIDTKDVMRAMASGKQAYTTAANASNKTADLNLNILKFIIEASKSGTVMVNAFTDRTHSDGSQHYKGLAIDLDLNTSVPMGKLNAAAAKYGGTKNTEGTHHHYDFPDRNAGPKDSGDSESLSTPSSNESSNSTLGSTKSSNIKSVYMRGDSITVGSITSGGIKEKFKKAGIDATITASGAGIVSRGGPPQPSPGDTLSGLDAVQRDKEKIKSVDAVVVAYGTNNYPSEMASEIRKMVNKIRSINKDVSIFWVNTDTRSNMGQSLNGQMAYVASSSKEKNQIIEKESKKLDYGVIDITAANLPLDDGIHPTYDNRGMGKWAQTVVDGVKEGASNGEETGNLCQCGGEGSGSLTGKNNEEKVWNYLTSIGLEPHVVAAIMGNINHEAGGFKPNLLEWRGGPFPSLGDYPEEGRGFGLVQWTFSDRQGPLVARAKKAGVKPSDLKIQLDHIVWELENNYASTYKKMKAGNVESATLAFELEYEVHAGGVQPERTADAKKFLAKYGSSGGGGGSSGVSCSEDSSGKVVGEYSLPVDRKIYDKNPEWFSKPHHTYPASDIPVGTGTKIYSMTAGKVIMAPVGGSCGSGVIIDTDDGVQYTYCHGTDGGSISGAKTGDKVKAGQLIMHSGNTGRSSGPHLHVEIEIKGVPYCPQKLFKSIADGSPVKENTLPKSGCVG